MTTRERSPRRFFRPFTPTLEVSVKPQTGRRFTIIVDASDTIGHVKTVIEARYFVPAQDALLVFRGGVLDDASTVEQLEDPITSRILWPIYLHWDEEFAENRR